MGYILPVQFDQYTQYQNRIGSKGKPTAQKIQIEKVKHAYLDTVKFSARKRTALSVLSYKKQIKQQSSSAEKVFAETTGIGRLFNVCV